MIVHANILDWAASYDGPLFHALLCDPPYHLTETVKRFGKPDSAPAKGDVYNRTARGFMGKTWDGGDIAYRPETWAVLSTLLHPGAFLMAFAGSRGYHRMACAIEDAGFIIHPAIGWAFGSGFPKATRIDTQVDRRAGVERTKVGTKKHQPKFAAAEFGYREKDNGYNSKARESFDVTAPATESAQAWQGHRYGGQALKPAFEFICVAQKPYAGRPVDSITRTGAGALWIDGARIGTDETWDGRDTGDGQAITAYGDGLNNCSSGSHPAGRWPANLVLQHHVECQPIGTRRVRGTKGDAGGYETIPGWRCHPDCAVYRLGLQSGESASGTQPGGGTGGIWSDESNVPVSPYPADTGTAARFFFQADYLLERLEDADAVVYEAKSSRSEREAGLDPRQVRLLEMMEVEGGTDGHAVYDDYQDTPEHGSNMGSRRRDIPLDTINDGREKPIDNPYQRGKTTRRNLHPTIKPIALARHSATLLLPPDMYAPRRLLIPFAGAGSEMIGAMLAGWEEIVGVELEADHVNIAEARLAYWQQRRHEFLDPSKPITAELRDAPDGQLDMFDEDD